MERQAHGHGETRLLGRARRRASELGITPQQHKAFQERRERQVLLSGQLRALAVAQQHWRRACDKAGDGARLACKKSAPNVSARAE